MLIVFNEEQVQNYLETNSEGTSAIKDLRNVMHSVTHAISAIWLKIEGIEIPYVAS